ncbi:MAG: response regulator, partial [Lentisphaeraceae bacterium]|nr:response regulator [Lentisphaeraceae bacterium]
MKKLQTIDNKILVVAAAQDFRSGMRSMLESAGYEVLSRQSVERTTQLLEVSEITMIVSDFELEDGNYFDLLKTIKESDTYYSETPIYCIGEKSSPDECVKTLEAGADEYSNKPLNRKIFLARTEKIVRTIKKAKNNPVTLELRVDPGEIPGVFQFLEAEIKTGYLKANCK